MRLSIIIFAAFSITDLSNTKPIENDSNEISENPELSAGFIEGDMITNLGRSSSNISTNIWPNATVFYKINEMIDDDHKKEILHAMFLIEANSCVRFVEANESVQAYVEISSSQEGCFAFVGYQGTPTFINLKLSPIGERCFRIGSILHELLHSMGFIHQHTDPQRDEYIEVLWDNIAEESRHNFQKLNVSNDNDIGYDIESVMHYPPKAFSKNGKETITVRHPTRDVVVGQRTHLTEKDIEKINNMYCS